MPSIKCTAKLAKRAGLILEPPFEDSREDRHSNIFTLDRRFYVIFCHDLTRLSVLGGPVRKPDLQNLGELLEQNLIDVLTSERFSSEAISHAVSRLDGLTPTKTNNRSVLGTINDNIFHTEVHTYHRGGVEEVELVQLAHFLNHMPMGPLNMDDAIEAYRRSNMHTAA